MLRAGVREVFLARRLAACGIAFACLALAGCAEGGTSSSQGPSARVIDVIDGDTVEVERIGRVRLIGVDTPEKGKCGDDAATRYTRQRLLDEVVQVELGEEEKDRYDRTLAYLTRDERMHNRDLLSEGYARVLTIPPNDKYAADFEEAEREAKPSSETASLATCDRNRRRAALRRRRADEKARRAAAEARERAREVRAEERRQARRARSAARRREEAAREREFSTPEEDSGGGGGSGGSDTSGPSTTNWCGKRDGDGDGIYCEGE
jgi:micrococcal nuclease